MVYILPALLDYKQLSTECLGNLRDLRQKEEEERLQLRRGEVLGKTIGTELDFCFNENTQDIRSLVPMLQGAWQHRERKQVNHLFSLLTPAPENS